MQKKESRDKREIGQVKEIAGENWTNIFWRKEEI
jgi:hypothetical protein